MSSHPRFNALPEAVAMYLSGQCRRWAIVDGHLVDLHQAAHPVVVQREEPEPERSEVTVVVADTAIVIDDGVSLVTDGAAPAPSVRECCRTCGRPLIGEVP